MKITLSLLFFTFLINLSKAQNDYLDKYNNTLTNVNVDNNMDLIKHYSTNKNVLKFMELGYFINGNTIAANFAVNDNIINNIILSGNRNSRNDYKWTVKNVSINSLNCSKEGEEFVLYEGYLFRYIAQYQYIYNRNKISDKNFAKNNFFKWYNKSVEQNGDASLLYGIRLHMGSHWATTAAYLMKLDPENKSLYNNFINQYNTQLRKSLKTININGKECYIWNSTYPDQFTKILKNRKKEIEIQDVTHGNHIIQYIIDCYSLGIGNWSKNDLVKFSNTLKYIIWKNNLPTDNVDGSSTKNISLAKTGWKQSDGWMKLMTVLKDKELYEIYDNYYKNNSSKVNKFYPNLQFFALMSKYQNIK